MATVKKYRFWILLTIFYIVTGSAFLLRYPIFNDEAIYIQILAARLLSVIAGYGTLMAVVWLGRWLHTPRAGFTAGVLYTLSPLDVFYDRLAVVDGLLTLLFAFLCLRVFTTQRKRFFRSMAALGVVIGLSLWVKSTALLLAVTAFIALIARKRELNVSSDQLALGIALAASIAGILFLPLLLQPSFERVLTMMGEYTYTFSQVLTLPFSRILMNSLDVLLMVIGYISPLVFWAAYSFWRSGVVGQRKLQVLFFFLFPLLAIVVFGKWTHSRYIVFTSVPLLVAAAIWLADRLQVFALAGAGMVALTALLILAPIRFFHLFPQYRMYAAEAWQYVDGWPSGYGVMEAIDYVDKHRSGLPALIGLRWDSGNPEDTVLFYAPRYPSLAAEYLDVGLERTKQVLVAWQGRPIYFITRKGQLGGWDPWLRPLATFPKPSGQEQVEVYAFAPKFQ